MNQPGNQRAPWNRLCTFIYILCITIHITIIHFNTVALIHLFFLCLSSIYLLQWFLHICRPPFGHFEYWCVAISAILFILCYFKWPFITSFTVCRPIMIQSIRAAALIRILRVRVDALMWKYYFTEKYIVCLWRNMSSGYCGVWRLLSCTLIFSFFLYACLILWDNWWIGMSLTRTYHLAINFKIMHYTFIKDSKLSQMKSLLLLCYLFNFLWILMS